MVLTRLKKLAGIEPRRIGGGGPRGFVGGLWHELGELQFNFLVNQGLRPDHAFLDIACGSLRAGVRLIPYLNTGNYLGIDIDRSLIDHGINNEIPQSLLELKQPEFVISGTFEFEKFSKRPDFAIAQSLFTHLIPYDISVCLRKYRAFSKPTSLLFATFFETAVKSNNPKFSDPHAHFAYTIAQMDQLGSQVNLRMDYIGDWDHPRGQKIVCYRQA